VTPLTERFNERESPRGSAPGTGEPRSDCDSVPTTTPPASGDPAAEHFLLASWGGLFASGDPDDYLSDTYPHRFTN